MQINKIEWTSVAKQSLNKTNNFILEKWNLEISNNFLSSVDSFVEIIEQNPYIGLKVEKTNFRRTLVNKYISLFYELNQSTLTILLIWDNRQDPKDLAID